MAACTRWAGSVGPTRWPRSSLSGETRPRDSARPCPVARWAEVSSPRPPVLLSDDASFLTGAVVPVDGGRAARGHDPEEI